MELGSKFSSSIAPSLKQRLSWRPIKLVSISILQVGPTAADRSDVESLRDTMSQLGDTPAMIHMETMDLAGAPRDIAEVIEKLDKKYGPISHLYAIAGITNYLDDESPLNLVS